MVTGQDLTGLLCIHFLSKQCLKAVEKTCLLRHNALKVCPQPGSNQIKPDLASISGVVCYFPLNFGFAIQHGRIWLGFCDPLPCWGQRSLLCSLFFFCCLLYGFGFWLQPRIIFPITIGALQTLQLWVTGAEFPVTRALGISSCCLMSLPPWPVPLSNASSGSSNN